MKFVVASDFHLGSEDEDPALVAAWVRFLDDFQPDYVVLNGDVCEGEAGVPRYREFKKTIAHHRYMAMRGNHDPKGVCDPVELFFNYTGVEGLRIEHGDRFEPGSTMPPHDTIVGHWHRPTLISLAGYRAVVAGCMCKPTVPGSTQGFVYGFHEEGYPAEIVLVTVRDGRFIAAGRCYDTMGHAEAHPAGAAPVVESG